MAPQNPSKPHNRRRNRKARTEVSSSDSSSSDSETASSPPAQKHNQPPKEQSSSPPTDSPTESSPAPDQQQPRMTDQQAFEQFYLTQATKEFANDLDKLRNASDFRGGQSVELLVRALKQGQACFGADEREVVGAAGS